MKKSFKEKNLFGGAGTNRMHSTNLILFRVALGSLVYLKDSPRAFYTLTNNNNNNGIYLPTEHLKSAQELVQHVSVHSRSNWNLALLVF